MQKHYKSDVTTLQHKLHLLENRMLEGGMNVIFLNSKNRYSTNGI
jgi:hypothetical protein